MNTTAAAKFDAIRLTLNAGDRKLVSPADAALRHDTAADALDHLRRLVPYMDDIDAGYEMIGLFA